MAVLLGGGLADRLASRGTGGSGARARLAVLGVALILAAPLAAGVLALHPPYAFLSLLGYYLFGKISLYALNPNSNIQLRPGLGSCLSP